jgi:SPP1 gp7 family putative phage head morphogenesis protein
MADAIPQKIDAPPKSQAPRRVSAERQLGTVLARSHKVWAALAIADISERLQLEDQRTLTPEEQAALIVLLLPRIDAWRDRWSASADTTAARQALGERISEIAASARTQAQRQIERTGVAPKQGVPQAAAAIAAAVSKMAADALTGRQQALVGQIAALAQKAAVGGNLDGLRAQIRELAAKDTKRAKAAARDLVGELQFAMSRAEAMANGFTHYAWRTQGDDRVRDSHAAKEGRIFTYAEGSDEGHPGQPRNCRCWAEPVRI